MNPTHDVIRTIELRKDGAFFSYRKIAAQFCVSRAALTRREQGFFIGITPGCNMSFHNNFGKEVNVRPCVTGHLVWRDATDTPQHNKRNNKPKEQIFSG
jgi:hypothetical protein